MSDEPLTNAAVENFRSSHDIVNELSELPSGLEHYFADNFVLDDRRKGGLNFGQLDRSSYVRSLEEIWKVGGRPLFSMVEVVGVRGERCAAYVEKIEFGESGMYIEHILVVEFDTVLEQSRRWVQFDLDDRDAAIAVLDNGTPRSTTSPTHPRRATRRPAHGRNARTHPAVLPSTGDGPAHPVRRRQAPCRHRSRAHASCRIADEVRLLHPRRRERAVRREGIVRPERHLQARHPELVDRAWLQREYVDKRRSLDRSRPPIRV